VPDIPVKEARNAVSKMPCPKSNAKKQCKKLSLKMSPSIDFILARDFGLIRGEAEAL
jgi:hypothetical protein